MSASLPGRRDFMAGCALGATGLVAGRVAAAAPSLTEWFSHHRADANRVVAFITDQINKLITMNINSRPGRGPRLPHPIVPVGSISAWGNMYYWDTHFTVRLLIALGRVDVAKNQVENCLALFRRFGYVPNANRYEWATRSQPPLLSSMARDVWEHDQDMDFLRACYEVISKEYEDFWTGPLHLVAGSGLSRYQDGGYGLARLLGQPVNRLSNLQAEAESGWDFTPRFEGRCMEFLPVDLNAFLYKYECDLAWMADILELPREVSEGWRLRIQARKENFNKYLWDPERGFFFDYDLNNKRPGPVWSLAGYVPSWAGVADEDQARSAREALGRFEHDHGLAVCGRDYGMRNKQWNFPNAWPPTTWWAEEALRASGFSADADRIAMKYLSAQTGLFLDHGAIYEKYNALTGGIDVTGGHEHGTSPMLGWSASTYLDFYARARSVASHP